MATKRGREKAPAGFAIDFSGFSYPFCSPLLPGCNLLERVVLALPPRAAKSQARGQFTESEAPPKKPP
jgi:hypothetical protein